MDKEKLMAEYSATLESLIEKTKFVYSEEYYSLDEFDKQKFQKNKMATEAHLSTLCEMIWGKKTLFDNGLSNMLALSILSSMFGYGGCLGSPNGVDHIKKTLDEDAKKSQEQVFAIPLNENKAE